MGKSKIVLEKELSIQEEAKEIRESIKELEREAQLEYIRLGKRICDITDESTKKINKIVDKIVKKKNRLRELENRFLEKGGR